MRRDAVAPVDRIAELTPAHARFDPLRYVSPVDLSRVERLQDCTEWTEVHTDPRAAIITRHATKAFKNLYVYRAGVPGRTSHGSPTAASPGGAS